MDTSADSSSLIPHDIVGVISRAMHAQFCAEFDWRWCEPTQRDIIMTHILTRCGRTVVHLCLYLSDQTIGGFTFSYELIRFEYACQYQDSQFSREYVMNIVRGQLKTADEYDRIFLIREITQILSGYTFVGESEDGE